MKQLALILGPILFSFFYWGIDISGLDDSGQATLGIALWIALWWVTEAVPIPVTGLLPIVLFPMTEVMSIEETLPAFSNKVVYLFLGGFIIASAIEKTNLHQRIALNIIHAIGTSWRNLLLGFILATSFLSMWISNTATAVMMLPIGLAVVSQIKDKVLARSKGKSLMLAIAYGSSCGGIATIIGTPTNMIFAGIVEDSFGQEISFLDWMKIGLPFSILMILIAWVYLVYISKQVNESNAVIESDTIKDNLLGLGKMSYQEKMVFGVFCLAAASWVFRDILIKPVFQEVNDTWIAICASILLFIIPSGKKDNGGILDWETAERIPWGILLLFGGGLALAEAFKVSGLAMWIGQSFTSLEGLSLILILLIVVSSVNFLTEVTSNVATAAMLMPILVSISIAINIHPYLLMVGTTFAASCAFMLPVATPPNAVVFGSGLISIPQMVKAGFLMNVLSIILTCIIVYFLLPIIWNINLHEFPIGWK